MDNTDISVLTSRLEKLEDLEAVRHTWRDYCIRLDSEDWSGLKDVFCEDATLEMSGLNTLIPGVDGVYRGRTGIVDEFYRPAIVEAAAENAGLMATGHLSTNMQINLNGSEATTLAYFFEIVANNQILIGTYQHLAKREPDRWRFKFLRISIRYSARVAVEDLGGQSLKSIMAQPYSA